jgi:hypothetical protein
MSTRARKYVLAAIVMVLAYAYARLGGDWSNLAFYAGGAGLLALVGVGGCFWIELAPDGAFRRHAQR